MLGRNDHRRSAVEVRPGGAHTRELASPWLGLVSDDEVVCRSHGVGDEIEEVSFCIVSRRSKIPQKDDQASA